MPRNMSDEQRKAQSDRMKAMHAKKRANVQQPGAPLPELDTPPAPPVAPDSPDLLALVTRLTQEVAELKASGGQMNPQQALEALGKMQGVNLGANGVQGVQYKYPVEKSHYPDPTGRLYDDPALRRFAMRENFFFKWDVVGETYEKANITYAEPRFTVELFRRLFDDDGTPTGKMVLVNRQFQMEDPLTTRVMADKLGITKSFGSFDDLMDEVRYLRIRSWLLAIFMPPKINVRRGSTTMVIDGKVVEVYDTEELTDAAAGADTAAAIKRETAITG